MKKILLIEDDPFLIDIYSTKLKEVGYDVVVAEDGERGLKMIKEENPDLVLLDIVLPNLNGWEVLRKLDKKDKTKIIILSNLGEKSEVEKGKNLGAAKYLVKAHYTPTEVVGEIKKILK